MNIQPKNQTQPISDDQELAKVLAGVNNDDTIEDTAQADSVPLVPPTPMPAAQPAMDSAEASVGDAAEVDMGDMPTAPEPMPATPPFPSASGSLENIKQEALGELRPLVDKLDVSPEEKFDTYLLILRSTDDRDLIAPAHEAAKNIADEARRAQALLDIIKEIDFLSQSQK